MADPFLRVSAEYLVDVYLPRIETALAAMPEERLWHRPHPNTTSVGTLLVHLAGNVRQWILSGLGGEPDDRDRAAEFARETGSSAECLQRLRTTVEAAGRAIRAMDADALARRHAIQGMNPTGLEAVYHVVEHFAWHTGQIAWMAKAHDPDHGIAYYDDDAINRARND